MGWELMKNYPEIEAVRIEIEPYRLQQARTWIREAHENGYQVIATYHDSKQLGSDSTTELMKAAHWWQTNYEVLSDSGPIIINIMNEWGSHSITPVDYADAYNQAISMIRTVYDGSLIVDVPGFGQATKIAADAYPYFDDQGIVYSVHIYSSAFSVEDNRWLSHEDLAYLDATGADCMVGEFCDTSLGGSDWCSMIDDCYANGWPLFGWAWNGDGRDMNMITPHWRDDPFAEFFEPTEFMQKIIDKLAGVACNTVADELCNDENIGEPCDDGNPYTVNDRFNEFCNCEGNFTSKLQSNHSGDPELIIYPNPVSRNQEFSLEVFNSNRTGELRIFNTLGELLSSQTVYPNQNRVIIQTSNFPTGLYYANFSTDKKEHLSKAFIVQ